MESPRIAAIVVSLSVLCVLLSGLPARALPTLDLTTAGASGYVNGGYFEEVHAKATGTGLINSFVRLGTNDPIEKGYNTDGTVEFNTKDDPHTHSLLLTAVPVVQENGNSYREFLLDIDQPGSKSLLSLDTIEIYLASEKDLTGYPNLGTKVFDLDLTPTGEPADSWILLDSNLNSGNGSGDMFAYIPSELFPAGDGATPIYVYLYSEFGASENSKYPNKAGFEEWAVRRGSVTPGPTPVPVPGPVASVLALLGSAMVVSLRRRLAA